MSVIARDPRAAASRDYDAIVVGGGIHGCMALLQAALAGRKVLLIDRADFGGETSFNSLRIIHGGLRYLQTLDLARFFESVVERRWLLRAYPDLVKPLPCLMPLYDEGLKRRSVMRIALALNDALSAGRNRGVRADRVLPPGHIVPPAAVRELWPYVRSGGLAGGAVWFDACAPDSHRVVMETLRWAAGSGGVALNYVEATGLEIEGGRVAGIEARDRLVGKDYRFRAPIVINAAGPWCSDVLHRLGQTGNVTPFSIAWNVLFDRPAATDHAVALTPPSPGAQTYFLHPWKGRLLIGTGHRPWSGGDASRAAPAPPLLESFIADINAAAPRLKLSSAEIVRVFSGLLPAEAQGSAELTKRPEIVDHGASGGVSGLFSMVGIKFTTARRTAQKALRLAGLCSAFCPPTPAPLENVAKRAAAGDAFQGPISQEELDFVLELADAESVRHADDLIHRRLGLITEQKAAGRLLELLKRERCLTATTSCDIAN